MLKILYVTATRTESEALDKISNIRSVPGGYRLESSWITPLVAGVGSISTAWEMQKWISLNDKPDLAINCGIAGSYRDDIKIGDVVMPVTDCFADAGVEDGNRFLTLSEAGLTDANKFPFRKDLIYTDNEYVDRLKDMVRSVKAITVNTATGSDATKERLVRKYNPDIETMEGAAFFYICRRENLPFIALRAISNIVETRNRERWNIPLAIEKLAEAINRIILTLEVNR